MNKAMLYMVLCGAGLLSGCAGMNSDFDCNKTATDQCLSMAEANKLASQGKSLDDLNNKVTPAKKPVAETLPTLRNSAPVSSPAPKTVSATSHFIQPRPIQTSSGNQVTSQVANPVRLATPQPATSFVRPNDAGKVTANRVPDATQRLWIAPWVDTGDNFHQPAVVEFIKTKSHWDDSWRVIGEGGE